MAALGFLVMARYIEIQCSIPIGSGAISAKTGLAALSQSSMPRAGMVDWFAPTVSQRWLARAVMTFPLGPQPRPTWSVSAGSVPVSRARTRISVVPRLPAPRKSCRQPSSRVWVTLPVTSLVRTVST